MAEPNTVAAGPRASFRMLFVAVYSQAWGLCVAYLGVGLMAEVLRRFDLQIGASAQRFLDGLPYFALNLAGLLDEYVAAVAYGTLDPFLGRLLLSSITLAAIFIQATAVGLLVAAFLRAVRGLAR